MTQAKLFRPRRPAARKATSTTARKAGPSARRTGPPRGLLKIHARAWELTENWITSVAEPRFAHAIKEALALTGGDAWEAIQRHFLNPIDITYYLLQGEVPSDKLPLKIVGDSRYNFLKLQAENSKLESYYPDQRILDLFRKVHRKVTAALLRLRRTKAKAVLLFPV